MVRKFEHRVTISEPVDRATWFVAASNRLVTQAGAVRRILVRSLAGDVHADVHLFDGQVPRGLCGHVPSEDILFQSGVEEVLGSLRASIDHGFRGEPFNFGLTPAVLVHSAPAHSELLICVHAEIL